MAPATPSLLLCAALLGDIVWPQFRGVDGDGHTSVTPLPVTWSESEHIVWKTPLPGRGWSSPVIGDGLVWVTTAVEHAATPAQMELAKREKLAGNPMANQMSVVGSITLRAVAVELDSGKVRHDIHLLDVENPQPVHSLNSFASPSPILTNGRLLCHFGAYGTACVDPATGRVLWTARLSNEHSVGPGSSPIVADDVLIVPCDGIEEQYVAALDVRTGEVVWKTPRPPMTGTEGDLHKAFSTPLLTTINGAPQAIIIGAQWAAGYEPKTGKELWRFRHGVGFSNVPRPVVGHGLIYLCTGYVRPELLALRVDGTGELDESHVVWRVKRQMPTQPSPVLVDRELYVVSDQGVATCLDALTGATLWQQRVEGNYSSSPLVGDGKIYFSSREGRTTVIHPAREYQVLSVNSLEGQLMASPAATPGRLFLRTDAHLYCIGER